MFKCMNRLAPDYLTSKFTACSDLYGYSLRSTTSGHLHLPRPKSEYFKKTFQYSGLIIWNSLPNDKKDSSHIESFKICSVEKIVNSGDTTYKLGCMDTTKCHFKRSSFGTDIETCRECCATDGCNLKGCGKDTIEIKRGPICFDCDGISEPTKCHHIKVCEADEICQALSGRLPIVGRRRRSHGLKQKRSVLCWKCCSTDLCNTHCGSLLDFTTTPLIPVKTTDMKTTSIELTTKVKTTPELATVVTTTHELTTLVTTTHKITYVATTRSSSKSMATGYYEYYIMFMETYHPNRDAPQVYIFATYPGTANIFSIHGNNNQPFVLSKGENTFDLSSSVANKGSKERKGVYILASVPIILFVFSRHDGETDGYLAIPSQFLSNFYIVPSFKVFKPSLNSRSVIGIVSTSNTTTHVKIKLNLRNNTKLMFNSTEFINGDTLSVVLSE
ncbi:unnamed protein product [Mytilus coruscus]|uniref:IgGFc-binding protein N-terminal domain-containing protein n=1 Tax=Mytilus coruscus TaxID=42192 RepID=A0A6J8CFA3_MYTCO|nr:unnamed protein product [Mytilus coruscus]